MAELKDINTDSVLPNNIIIEDSKALKQAIIAFINTNPGEILFEPSLGSGVQNYIYAQANSLTVSTLEFALNNRDNKCSLVSVFSFLDIVANVDIYENKIYIFITYTDPFTQEENNINLSIDNIT